ncbi:uncharacterized protein LOC133290710 isoform X2 [Gastrolobium bilobum]|uniref:uncharacterized protein LOC133290710 isoform X2 n=1 Tax=Gastrolobium bilobum TaxID=150636 RepID=UPI002AB26FC4|nr:uncharacterized protein LOC133290710 isoform X2 [Gastrolobium bilobum]
MTGSGGCFTLEKKKDDNEIVEKVKATYAVLIDDDISYNVKVKITTDIRVGLNVEVEDPVKLTMDYTKQLISRMRGKMEYHMEANIRSLFSNAIDGGGDRKTYLAKYEYPNDVD